MQPASSRYMQVDVFTARAGGGNPLGVVLDGTGWSDAAMQAFATWTDLVETTFVLPPDGDDADYRLRIFTPSREIPFAGHPSVGSAHALLAAGLVAPRDGALRQACGAGILPVRVEDTAQGRRIFVQAPAARVLERGDAAARLRPLLGDLALGALPPALVEGGRRWWLVELADEAALRAWRPEHAAIAALAHDTDSLGLCAFARSADPGFELALRAFPAGAGIVEDPASGAANGLVAAYIVDAEPDGPLARGYRVSQGREIGRDAHLVLRVEDGRVWVGGETQTVIDGSVRWPR
ncbi:PhzF family phenazine biosynthesis protein [Coralloluteibacterium thermophilus]|uniref:PhzF family phenazine biosynthesis protein n=1 Tax=Coralloluteibacterium thermophilum TaxID=2707049 RepID=A0ABV9NI21_9GAMM